MDPTPPFRSPQPPLPKCDSLEGLLLEVTQGVVDGTRAVVDMTPPSSASSSPPTNHPHFFKARAAGTSTSCSARRANGCAAAAFELRVRSGDHSHAPGLMRMSAAHASSDRMAITLLTTSTSSTPLAGFMTFSWAAGMALRGREEQQRVRCGALERRDPSTIIPNTSPHAAHVARAPSATAGAHCSYLACAGCGCCGWRPRVQQHGSGTLSFFMGPSPKPWAVLAGTPDVFLRASEQIYNFRLRFAALSQARGGWVGGSRAHVDRYTVELCIHVL